MTLTMIVSTIKLTNMTKLPMLTITTTITKRKLKIITKKMTMIIITQSMSAMTKMTIMTTKILTVMAMMTMTMTMI